MYHRDSAFDWAIPCGTAAGVRLRVSPLLIAVAAVVCVQRGDARLGVLFGLCLLAAAAVHEAARLAALRFVRVRPTETILLPLGGSTRTATAAPPAVSFAGPVANLAAALGCLAAAGAGGEAFNPLRLPAVDLDAAFGAGLASLGFFANWLTFLANLLPAAPLDGGRVAEHLFANRLGPALGQQALYRVGFGLGVAAAAVGLCFESAWLVAFGGALALFNLREVFRQQISETLDESFMGYDFSQGYTSLEKSSPVETEVKAGVIRKWLARRRTIRQERRRQRDEQAERELDALLEKVHTRGLDSLTDTERRILRRASDRYRGRSRN